jgi:hypothetical protein
MNDSKMPLSRALLWILVSTLFISGSAFMGWLYFLHLKERRIHDEQYHIVAIIQSTPLADALKTVYLAEILDLSLDRPINLYQFNTSEAVQILLRHPLIKSATIKKILPGTLYIDYQMRVPVAYVGDLSNTAIDEEGYLLPFRPFFTPKRLPTLYLGLEKKECQWGNCLKNLPSLTLAFGLLEQFKELKEEKYNLKQVDVMQALADSYGQRQVILMVEECVQEDNSSAKRQIYLRLSSDHTEQDLTNFRTLMNVEFEKKDVLFAKANAQDHHPIIIDFRIPHLAFIKAGG